MPTIYYHYFKLMLRRTDNSHTKRVNIMVTSANETVSANDMCIAFKSALREIENIDNVKFEYLKFIRTEVHKQCQ